MCVVLVYNKLDAVNNWLCCEFVLMCRGWWHSRALKPSHNISPNMSIIGSCRLGYVRLRMVVSVFGSTHLRSLIIPCRPSLSLHFRPSMVRTLLHISNYARPPIPLLIVFLSVLLINLVLI